MHPYCVSRSFFASRQRHVLFVRFIQFTSEFSKESVLTFDIFAKNESSLPGMQRKGCFVKLFRECLSFGAVLRNLTSLFRYYEDEGP